MTKLAARWRQSGWAQGWKRITILQLNCRAIGKKNSKFKIKHNDSLVSHFGNWQFDFTCCHGCRHHTPWSVGNLWDWQVVEGSWWKLELSSATDWDAPLSAADKGVSGSVCFLGLNKVLVLTYRKGWLQYFWLYKTWLTLNLTDLQPLFLLFQGLLEFCAKADVVGVVKHDAHHLCW